jgi:hypothetical protein
MLRKLSALVVSGAIVVSTLGFTGATIALAAAPGSGSNSAMAPAGNWMPVAAGQQEWFAFHYAGDNSQILARMSVDPADSAGFEIWTPAQFQQYQQGNAVTPVGRGSVNNNFGGDLTWSGNFDTPGTYYVVVTQTGPNAGNFSLNVSGDGVTFLPAQAAPAARAAAPVHKTTAKTTASKATAAKTAASKTSASKTLAASAKATNVATRTSATTSKAKATAAKTATSKTKAKATAAKTAISKTKAPAGSTPNNAAQFSHWDTLGVGQQRWYSFQYPGDNSQVTLDMTVDPANPASFEVWTPGQFRQYQNGETVTPIGRGTVDNAANGDLVWSGHFDTAGTYYVIVSQTGPDAAGYMLALR